jgi:hypothetical protein
MISTTLFGLGIASLGKLKFSNYRESFSFKLEKPFEMLSFMMSNSEWLNSKSLFVIAT